MRIDESRGNGGAGEIDHAGPPAPPCADIRPATHGHDEPRRDGERRRRRAARIERDDAAILENPVGGHVHPAHWVPTGAP